MLMKLLAIILIGTTWTMFGCSQQNPIDGPSSSASVALAGIPPVATYIDGTFNALWPAEELEGSFLAVQIEPVENCSFLSHAGNFYLVGEFDDGNSRVYRHLIYDSNTERLYLTGGTTTCKSISCNCQLSLEECLCEGTNSSDGCESPKDNNLSGGN